MGAWRETPEGEWWEDALGVVIGVQGTIWFCYPESGGGRVGPFASFLEAQRALVQEARGGDAAAAVGANDLYTDEDRPTEKLQRRSG